MKSAAPPLAAARAEQRTGAALSKVRVGIHKLRLHQIGPGVNGSVAGPPSRRYPSHVGQPLRQPVARAETQVLRAVVEGGGVAAAVAVPTALVRRVGALLLTGGLHLRVGPRQDFVLQLPLLPLLLLQICHQTGVARQFGQAGHRAVPELALPVGLAVGGVLRLTRFLLPLLLLLFPLYHLRRDLGLHHPQPVPLVWGRYCEDNNRVSWRSTALG
ncbi:hypothetical protein EYF80_024591 [Liparis tanakae]|uniref:Uncharacterized protein n=1 Tax=Liparis tanakae TaxID=230148 RepID=A0A4Z2HJT1_9TELE|nr:hypothetical protein EYF80_024591 [Liparis tanakae]